MKLNESQKSIVSNNYYLVEKIMNKYGMKDTDVPDWHGAISVALCTAASEYDDTEVPFYEFLLPYIAEEIKKERPCGKVRDILVKILEDIT